MQLLRRMSLPFPWRPARYRRVTALALLAACGDSSNGPVPVASVDVTVPAATLIVGQSLELAAVARDGASNVVTGRSTTWSTSDTLIARVSGSGVVTGVAPGPVVVLARVEGKVGQAALQVLPVPVATVEVSAAANEVFVAQSVQLTAVSRDAAGNVLAGRPIAWSSSDTTRVRVTPTGLATGVAPGAALVTATSEGRSGTLALNVLLSSTAPTITSVAPATLVPGATMTITGTGFDPVAANNAAMVRGVPAQILTASATQLVARVPCVNSGTAAVVVSRHGITSAPAAHAVAVPARSVGLGQALVLDATDSQCLELAGSGRYVLVVYSAATSVNSLVDFRLSGNTPTGAAMVPQIAAATAQRARQDAARDAAWVHDSVHHTWLERERQLYEELRGRQAQLGTASLRMPSPATPVPGLGDMRSLFYNRGGCNDTTNIIRGRAIYVGARAIIWEDSANSIQSSANPLMAQAYQRLGTIFDQDQYRIVRENFGDPLRRDPFTDNDGRIHMIFTQRLVGSGAAAYVTSCDQFPRTTAPASNFGEFFYGYTPTSTTPNLNSTASIDGWFTFMARTVVHEVKHIASHAARVANGAPAYEQSWLEEGTARHAEELWIRADLHRVPWKANAGWGSAESNGVFCDFNPANATCNALDPLRRPSFGMRRHFNEIKEKLDAPWDWSPYGTGTGQGGSVFYQTAWSLVRWIIDRYGSSDAAFLTTLNNALTNGVTNLSTVAGAPMDRMIGLWGLALFADDYPGLAAPSADISFPTWNLRSIYAGLNTDPGWLNRWNRSYPIQPVTLAPGSFTTMLQGLRGGAHAYYLLELGGGAQLLNLQAPDGTAASSSVRIALARLE